MIEESKIITSQLELNYPNQYKEFKKFLKVSNLEYSNRGFIFKTHFNHINPIFQIGVFIEFLNYKGVDIRYIYNQPYQTNIENTLNFIYESFYQLELNYLIYNN
jgi:hypothetical protein